MDAGIRDGFIALWRKYFNGVELPITFYYTDEEGHAELAAPGSLPRCVVGMLMKVRRGKSICLNADSIGCFGGKRYLGYAEKMFPNFEYFLSCGIPGKMKGERYKKSPELVRESMQRAAEFRAPGRFVVFKRWDMLEAADEPAVVIFFASPDVLSGLFTLANFDEADPNGVIAPFGAGCSSVVLHPYLESKSSRPRAVIGMFDVTARPLVPKGTLTFSVPIVKFAMMVGNMEESFLITDSWKSVQKRI